jgi:ribokinase
LEGGLRRVIVTLGANGALLVGKEGDLHVSPFQVAPVDTTEAGDEEAAAISRANLYAALSTTVPGTQKSFVTRESFDREWETRK